MPNAEPQIIFDAKTQRYGGLFSKANAATLPLGTYSVSKNWRFDENLPRGRWGMGRISSATLAVGHTVGGWSGTLNGQPYQVWAQYVDSLSEIVLYKYTSFSTLDEITQTTGSGANFKYQDTRIAYSSPGTAGNPIHFAPVKDNSNGKEYLVIGCGDDYARVWDPTVSTTGSSVAINQPMATPNSQGPIQKAVVTFPKYFTVKDESTTTPSASGTRLQFTEGSSAGTGENYMILTQIAGGAVGNSATVTFSSAVDLSACKQLIFLIDTTYTSLFENCQVGIIEGGGAETVVWDPTDAAKSNDPLFVDADSTTNRKYVAFSLEAIAASSRNAVDAIRFTFVRGTSSSQTVNIYGIFGSGKIFGQAFHALSHFNNGSRAESAGTWFEPSDYTGEYVRNLGARNAEVVSLPNDPRLYYDYRLPIKSPVTADVEAGWDYIRVYRSDAGEEPLLRTLVSSTLVAQFTAGAWVYESGFATGALATITDNTENGTKNTAVLAPDFNTRSIPKSSALLFEAERLFAVSYAASSPTGVTTSPSALWASDKGHFSRFRYFHQTENQGTSVQLSGEIGHELKSMPTALRGVPACYLWTDSNLYRFTPTAATQINFLERVAPFGTLTKFSVATSKDSVFWLDQSRVVRKMSPSGIDDISSFAVQDKLDQIGGAAFYQLGLYGGWFLAFGAYHNEKYYLSFDRDGSTSATSNIEEPLVYDDRLGVWVEDDLGGTTTYSARFPTSFRGKLFVASIDRRIYEYEQTNAMTDGYDSSNPTPGGTAFDLTLETGYLQMVDGMGFVVDQSAVMNDDVASGTCTVTATYLPDGSAPTMTIDVDDSSSVLWSMSTKPTNVSGKGQGVSAKLKAVFASTAGTAGMRLYKWAAFVSPRAQRPTNYNT